MSRPYVLDRRPARVCAHCGKPKNLHQPRSQRCPVEGRWDDRRSPTRFTAAPVAAINPTTPTEETNP